MNNFIETQSRKRNNIFSFNQNDYKNSLTELGPINLSRKSKLLIYEKINVDVIDHYSMKMIAEIMKMTNKSSFDTNILLSFMKKLDELMTMIKQVSLEKSEDLLLKITLSLKHKYLESSRVIFKYGSKGDVFYIILYGSVDILIPKEQKLQMTEEEYIKYLIKLKKYDELELLNKTINANKNIYRVEDFISSIFSETPDRNILAKKKSIWKTLEKDVIDAIDYVNNVNKEKEGYISSSKYIENLTPDIYDNKTEKNLVTVYKYYSVINLKQGSKFGDVALDSSIQKRIATIITLEDTHLGILHKSFYEQCIKSVNEKIIKNNVNFICSTKLFSNINKYDFHKNYINNFAYEKITRNTKLIEQGKEPSHVYILKSGEYEVYFKRSIYQLNDLILSLGGTLDIFEDESDIYRKVKSEIRYTKLTIIKDFDIIGLDDCIINNTNSFTVECTSNTGEIFRIHTNILKNMCEKQPSILENMADFVKLKRKFYLNRIEDIKKNLLKINSDINKLTIRSCFDNHDMRVDTKFNKIFNNFNTSPGLNKESSSISIKRKIMNLPKYESSNTNKQMNLSNIKMKTYSGYINKSKRNENKFKIDKYDINREYYEKNSSIELQTSSSDNIKVYNISEKIKPNKTINNNDIDKDLPKKINVIDCLAMDTYDNLYKLLETYSSDKNILENKINLLNQDKYSLEGLYSKHLIIENKNLMNIRDSKLKYNENKVIDKLKIIKPKISFMKKNNNN